MKKNYLYISFLFLIFSTCSLQAQEKPKRDSLYEKIETFSKKKKIGKFFYHLIFRNIPDAVVVPVTDTLSEKQFAGKHIRNIYITTYDPLGYTSNLEERDKKWYENVGNRLHMKSRNFAVRGYLLFKKGDEYNHQKLYESERILRDTKFINRVSIKAIPESATQDSVDIAVKVLDSWSLKPYGEFTGKKLGVGLGEENFLGMGHELLLYYRTNFKTKQNYQLGRYKANNIYGTYIDAEIRAEKDFDRNENFYFKANREFISPLTKWGAGINSDYYRHIFRYPTDYGVHPDELPITSAKAHNQDFWGGYQFQLKNAGSKDITDNIFASGRFQNFAFVESPGEQLDPSGFFRSYQMYLGSVGFTRRKFEIKKNIFSYEKPEDIPYGSLLSLTGGWMKQRGEQAYPYIGATAGFGTFTDFGYYNYRLQYGTFFRDGKTYRSALRLDGTYFSPLRDYGAVNLRHFFSQTLVIGNHRSESLVDRINISTENEFPEYNMYYLGNDKLVLRYQLQLFIKKPWKNFQINPYFTTAFGLLSNDTTSLFSSKGQTKFGVGVLFYNPYLAFSRFQFSFMYYPKLPFDGGSAFDINGYKNYYMPIYNFSGGRPDIVDYHPSKSF